MVNSEKISHVTSLLRRSNLEKIRACYVGYSNDFDARGECRAYEERITAAQKKPRNEAWTTEIYAIRGARLSSAAMQYFKLKSQLDSLVAEADSIAAGIRGDRQAAAKALDDRLDSFVGILSDKTIAEARVFVQTYRNTPREVQAFCKRATADEMKRFEARLDQNQKENAQRAKAESLDSRFQPLTVLKRDRSYFSSADAVIAEVRATPYEVMRFCKSASEKAAKELSENIKKERRYLDCEERVSKLVATKAHTLDWCDSAWAVKAFVALDSVHLRNSDRLDEMMKEADRIKTEIVCAPYLAALPDTSDFKKVIELDEALAKHPDKDRLGKGIASFDTKWKQRVKLAWEQAGRKADEYCEEGRTLYNKKNYERAYPLFVAAYKYGNYYAAYMLGRHYCSGNGVAKNVETAREYFKKAADKGIAPAMSALADVYQEKGDKAYAFSWRKRAVESGFVADLVPLAKLYYDGFGTAQDYREARRIFEKVEEANIYFTEANAYLGAIYEKGQGVAKNEELALGYYEKAKSIAWAKKAYDALFDKLDGEKRDKEIMETYALAEAGNPEAQYFIGCCYYDGYRTSISYDDARYWFEKAAKQCHVDANSRLGDMYFEGKGVAVDKQMAKYYYLAAERLRGK